MPSPPFQDLIENLPFRAAVDLLDAGDMEGLRRHLTAHPDVVHEHVSFPEPKYFRSPTLLQFVAENPVRRGTLPPNIVTVARTIIDLGAKQNLIGLNKTLALVSSGRVPRECSVQVPLIHLLCDCGALPDCAIPSALPHGEFEAVRTLLARGAKPDLSVLAAFGDTEEARRVLEEADEETRHRALALASQFGHAQIVELLLEAGECPNRFNPPGFHAHSTPLHQAALAGHNGVVRLLLAYGARRDIKDTVWQGTPAGWAQYAGNSETEALLEDPSGTLVRPGAGAFD